MSKAFISFISLIVVTDQLDRSKRSTGLSCHNTLSFARDSPGSPQPSLSPPMNALLLVARGMRSPVVDGLCLSWYQLNKLPTRLCLLHRPLDRPRRASFSGFCRSVSCLCKAAVASRNECLILGKTDVQALQFPDFVLLGR